MKPIGSLGEVRLPDLPPALQGMRLDDVIGRLRVRLHELPLERLVQVAWVVDTGGLAPTRDAGERGGQVLDFPVKRARAGG